MSLASNQPEKLQSDAKLEDPSPGQPASESTEVEEEEDEGECGTCLFMKGGGCKDTFVDWQNCIKEAEDKKEYVEKCSQVTARLIQCMNFHSDYYGPIIKIGKHVEEKAVVELEKEMQDSIANISQQEAPSQSNQT